MSYIFADCNVFRLKLLPRVLRGISELTTETSILGVKIAMPICIAPTACQKMAHLDGEIATVKGGTLILIMDIVGRE